MAVPQRIAFIHLMRTGGVTVDAILRESLAPTHRVCQSWAAGIRRDWSQEEMLEFADFSGPLYVHNHVASWNSELIAKYRQRGFFLFALVRNVGDQLCSLYHWMKEQQPHVDLETLDAFVLSQLRGESWYGIDYQHWAIPYWWRALDTIQLLDEPGLSGMLTRIIGNHEVDATAVVRKCNASISQGFLHSRAVGEISETTSRLLSQSTFSRRFREVIDHFCPTDAGE